MELRDASMHGVVLALVISKKNQFIQHPLFGSSLISYFLTTMISLIRGYSDDMSMLNFTLT